MSARRYDIYRKIDSRQLSEVRTRRLRVLRLIILIAIYFNNTPKPWGR